MIAAADIEHARDVQIDEEVARRGIKLRRVGAEMEGPCPHCGGSDRFGVNVRKQIWNCRQCGVGGDVIRLVQHIDRCDFASAIETLVGDTARAAPAAKPISTRREDGNDDKQRASKAAWLWSKRKLITEGTEQDAFKGAFVRTVGAERLWEEAIAPAL
jgi:DNA primase